MSDFGNSQKPIQLIPILKESLSFERPNGYLVMKKQESTYSFFGFLNNKLSMISIFSISYDDLGITIFNRKEGNYELSRL